MFVEVSKSQKWIPKMKELDVGSHRAPEPLVLQFRKWILKRKGARLHGPESP